MWLLLPLLALAEPSGDEGTVSAYVARALEGHPSIAADEARWRASLERIPGQRSLPEPRVTVGGFVQSVETRVGPQQARLGVQQAIPWPSRLVQSGKAATSDAAAAEQRVDARARVVRARVEEAYWRLWQVRASIALRKEHLDVLDGLSSTIQARIEVGSATLADLQQVSLTRTRLEDAIQALDAEEEARVAMLRAAVGTDIAGAATTDDPFVTEPPEALEASSHPDLAALDATAEAWDHRSRAAAAQRLPDLTLGADWIVTGPSEMDGVADSGKDAIALGVGLKVPLWQGRYGHDVEAARQLKQSALAQRSAHSDDLQAAVDAAAVRATDRARAVRWIDETLLPQALAAHDAVLGAYAVGRAQVAQTLLAQRDLLDLELARVDALAEHAVQWARLTSLTGREP